MAIHLQDQGAAGWVPDNGIRAQARRQELEEWRPEMRALDARMSSRMELILSMLKGLKDPILPSESSIGAPPPAITTPSPASPPPSAITTTSPASPSPSSSLPMLVPSPPSLEVPSSVPVLPSSSAPMVSPPAIAATTSPSSTRTTAPALPYDLSPSRFPLAPISPVIPRSDWSEIDDLDGDPRFLDPDPPPPWPLPSPNSGKVPTNLVDSARDGDPRHLRPPDLAGDGRHLQLANPPVVLGFVPRLQHHPHLHQQRGHGHHSRYPFLVRCDLADHETHIPHLSCDDSATVMETVFIDSDPSHFNLAINPTHLTNSEANRDVAVILIGSGYIATTRLVNAEAKYIAHRQLFTYVDSHGEHSFVFPNTHLLRERCSDPERLLRFLSLAIKQGVCSKQPSSFTLAALKKPPQPSRSSMTRPASSTTIHLMTVYDGYLVIVSGGYALIDLLAKEDECVLTRNVFDEMPTRDVSGLSTVKGLEDEQMDVEEVTSAVQTPSKHPAPELEVVSWHWSTGAGSEAQWEVLEEMPMKDTRVIGTGLVSWMHS